MPHIVIEYSNVESINNRILNVMESVEGAAVNSGVVPKKNLKLRAKPYDHFLVAGENMPFIHVTVSMMEGPTVAQKTGLSADILNALEECLPDIQAITVDIRDMNRAAYGKRVQI